MIHTNLIKEKGSIFRGHAFKAKSSSEICLAYSKLKLLYPESDHIMIAYVIKSYSGHHDNGEHGASAKLLKILMDRSLNNTALFVTCEFGGIHLGPRRFLHFEKASRSALDELSQELR